ncbi:histidine phosphatase family protein [Subtercola endophyticus]|uniref:histidine phosphatase family protein n=1 Tax=Subtercola endophyticus TaxID=2895559 RepID=UPI001E375762|nr:histidine phosphatase family protein [Subtercola endophyticus]UFS59015.1 histidine phosphatase family protein [Subtercola endophyticus]
MTASTTLALVRHGETEWNAERRLQGSTDIPLNDIGRAQVRATAELLRDTEWDFIVCSPLERARESASILGAELGVPVVAEIPRIVERHYGLAEGLQDGEQLRALRIPGGFEGAETEREVADRAAPALAELVAEHPGARIIVVAHGTLIRIAMKALSGEEIPTITNAAHSVLVHSPSAGEADASCWSVTVVNGELHRPSVGA